MFWSQPRPSRQPPTTHASASSQHHYRQNPSISLPWPITSKQYGKVSPCTAVHARLLFGDSATIRMQSPTRHEPYQANQMRPQARLTRSFVRDLHTDLGLGWLAANQGCMPSPARTFHAAVTKDLRPQQGARRTQTHFNCWGGGAQQSIVSGVSETWSRWLKAPMSNVGLCLCLSACLPTNQEVAQGLSTWT